MKKKLSILLVTLTASILTSLTAYGQSCPPEDAGCTAWSQPVTTSYNFATLLPECRATITYRTRVCNGVTEYFFVSIDYIGVCKIMEEFNLYQYSYNAAIEMITLGFIEYQAANQGGIFPCSTSTVKRAIVYTASCGIWVGCEYEIDESAEVICDPGYQPPNPDYGATGNKKVKVYKWQSCGTTCCKRVFEICTQHSTTYGGTVRIATQISKERLSECSESANYSPLPCQDGC